MLHFNLHIYVDIPFQFLLNNVQCMQGIEVYHHIDKIINCISIILQTVLLKLLSAVKGLQTGVASVKVSLFFFVCLFGVYRPSQEFFTHMETSQLPVKGCKILTYARHSWPSSIEGSFACHTDCNTVNPFIMVISEDP